MLRRNQWRPMRRLLEAVDGADAGWGVGGGGSALRKLTNKQLGCFLFKTPMTVAAEAGRDEMAMLLLEFGADVDGVDASGATPLEKASVSGRLSTVRLLLERGASRAVVFERGESVLHRAAIRRVPEVLGCLVEGGVPVDGADAAGRTALSCAAVAGDVRSVKVLVQHGAVVDRGDAIGRTPLHLACQEGTRRPGMVPALLECGADKEARDIRGWTPLSHVARWGLGEPGRLLLEAGASVDAVDGFGSTPLHVAVKHAVTGSRDETVTMVRELLRRGASTGARDAKGWTPLFWAASLGCDEACRFLLAADRASAKARDGRGSTPLHEACKRNSFGYRATVELLLEAGADVAALAGGLTPLMLHQQNGQPGRTRVLLLEYERRELHRHENCPVGLWPVMMGKYHANIPEGLDAARNEIGLIHRTLCGKPDFFVGRVGRRRGRRKRRLPRRLVSEG